MENRTLTPEKENSGLADAIDRILDKGLVINADIAISVAGVELLGIKIRAALASFETAAKYRSENPAQKMLPTEIFSPVMKEYHRKNAESENKEELLNLACPWCGWESARSKKQKAIKVEAKVGIRS